MYLNFNEGKFVAAERCIRAMKNNIFKNMTVVSKNVMLDDIVNKYNNAVHRTTKMKPIDVTSYSYVEYNEDSNEKGPKFKGGDRIRI